MQDGPRAGSLSQRLAAATTVVGFEDDADIAEFLRAYFRASGYAFVHVDPGSVADAMAAIRQHEPACILLDVGLRGFSGLDIFRRIRDEPTLAALPIIVVTADVTAGHPAQALTTEIDAVVSKPFNVNSLASLVGDCIDAARRGRSGSTARAAAPRPAPAPVASVAPFAPPDDLPFDAPPVAAAAPTAPAAAPPPPPAPAPSAAPAPAPADGDDDDGAIGAAVLDARLDAAVAAAGQGSLGFALVTLRPSRATRAATGPDLDDLLRRLLGAARPLLPAGTVLARTASQEVVVLAPGHDADATATMVTKAFGRLAGPQRLASGIDIDVDLVAGVAAHPEHASDAAGLFMAADGALDDATTGGDPVVVAP